MPLRRTILIATAPHVGITEFFTCCGDNALTKLARRCRIITGIAVSGFGITAVTYVGLAQGFNFFLRQVLACTAIFIYQFGRNIRFLLVNARTRVVSLNRTCGCTYFHSLVIDVFEVLIEVLRLNCWVHQFFYITPNTNLLLEGAHRAVVTTYCIVREIQRLFELFGRHIVGHASLFCRSNNSIVGVDL